MQKQLRRINLHIPGKIKLFPYLALEMIINIQLAKSHYNKFPFKNRIFQQKFGKANKKILDMPERKKILLQNIIYHLY